MSNNEIRFRVALDGAQQVQTGAQAAAQGMQQLAQASGSAQKSAGLAGHQTAQLSAQLQDLFIQIQAGQSPLTAFAQQGSQLSAVFGGAGNALRAVAGLVTPAVLAFAGVAAAVGVVAYAFLQGEKERLAFARGIVLTGNAAGVTAGQLNEMAKAAASFGASRGQGAEVLSQLVASGQVASSVLGKATEAAIRLQRDGGVAIDQTVKAFAEIGKNPVEAIKRLNEGQNFLSAGTYKQIRALQDQGKEFEAARLAQETYATASIGRTKELAEQLGTLEKAWRFVGREAAAAWQAILNVGRQETLEERLARAQAVLEEAQRLRRLQAFASSPLADVASKQAEVDLARELISLDGRSAAAKQATAEAADKGIKAVDKLADAAKKAAEEFKHLAEAGRDMVRAWDLSDAGFDPSFLQQMKELQAYAKAAGLSTDQLAAATERLLAKQPFAERELKAIQEVARARADARAAEDKGIGEFLDQQQKARDASLASAQDSILKLQEENAAAELMRGTNLTLAEAIEQVGIARLREQQARYTEGSEPYIAVEREIEARQRLLSLLGDKRVREANQQAADDALRVWQQAADLVADSLADAIMDGGRDGTERLRRLFAQLVLRPIVQFGTQQLANGAVQLASGALNAASGNTYLQTAGSVGSVFSGANNAASVFGAYAPAANYAAVYSGQAYGTGFASQQSAMLAAQEAGMVSTAGGTTASGWAASAGWIAAAILGAMKASSDYSEGFTAQGAERLSSQTGGLLGGLESTKADILSRLGFSDRLASLLTGATAVSKIIGRADPRVEALGFQGSIQGGDFTGTAYADILEKGGIFRSDKRYTETTALGDELGRFLDVASKGILDKAKDFGAALGLPVDALANVSQQIKVALTDDATKNQAAITEALGGYGDLLVAGFAEAIRPLAGYIDGVAETTAQTLSRVGASITGVNEVLDALGLSALKASIDGGRAATQLEALFGGLGTLQQAAGSYLQAYYSDAERAALATKGIGQALAGVGLSVPATRDAFRGLVQAQDLTTNAGREAFAALMGVADAFAAITPEARSAADILNERNDLEKKRLTLLGDTAALRQLELDALDASNRALQQMVWGLESAAALQSAVDTNIVKFLSPAQATDYQYGTVARDLQSAGLLGDQANLGATLKAATKDDIYEFARQFVELTGVSTDAKTAIVEAAGALADLKDAAVATADEFARRITQFTSGLRSSDLSPLSYQEQLATARGLYDSTLARAQSGDPSAQQDLLGNAQAYLQEARSFFGSSADYANAFRRVTTELDALGAPSADPQLQAIREQVTQLEAMRSSVVDLSTTSSTRANTQADLARAQIAELQKVVLAQGDTNAALAAGHRALWDQLEALNARVQRLLDNAQLEATAPS